MKLRLTNSTAKVARTYIYYQITRFRKKVLNESKENHAIIANLLINESSVVKLDKDNGDSAYFVVPFTNKAADLFDSNANDLKDVMVQIFGEGKEFIIGKFI